MSKILTILKDNYKSLPLLKFIAFCFDSLFKRERVLIYCKPLRQTDTVDIDAEEANSIVMGKLDDLAGVRRRMANAPWELKCDLYDGVTDFFWYRDGQTGAIGHISWLYYKNDPNRILRLGDKDCEVMFCLTSPEYRGRGLYPRALQKIMTYLTGRGYEWCFICVRDDNRSSIRGIEKAGFRVAGTVMLRKLMGIQTSLRGDTRRLKRNVAK